MPAHNAAIFDQRRRPRRETGRDHDTDTARHYRRFLAIGCEISTARVPTLGWPPNLFVDNFISQPESAT
jgi:hypothetical protein